MEFKVKDRVTVRRCTVTNLNDKTGTIQRIIADTVTDPEFRQDSFIVKLDNANGEYEFFAHELEPAHTRQKTV